MENKIFTVEQGIEIQTDQLNMWKTVLKEEVYLKLVSLAIKDNDKASSGYDVLRGSDLSSIVANISSGYIKL